MDGVIVWQLFLYKSMVGHVHAPDDDGKMCMEGAMHTHATMHARPAGGYLCFWNRGLWQF